MARIHKSIALLLIFLSLGISKLVAQDCPVVVKSEDLSQILLKEEAYKQHKSQSKSTSSLELPYTVNIMPHIIRDDNGNGGLSDEDLHLIITELNELYEQVGIIFEYCDINYVDENEYFNDGFQFTESPGIGNPTLEYELTDNYPPISNLINIYFVPNLIDGSGWSAHPGQSSNRTWIMMENKFLLDGSINTNMAKTLAHEVGHFFSLFHVYEDHFGHENVTRLATDPCYNCETTGDLLCDTVAQIESTVVDTTCTTNNDYISIPATDNCGVTWETPDFDNIMTKYRNCRTIFTPGQIERMLTSLEVDYPNLARLCDNCPIDNYVVEELSGTANENAQQRVIANNLVYSGSNVVYQAGESITLLPGFHAADNSIFLATIAPCIPSELGRYSNSNTMEDTTKTIDKIYPNPTSNSLTIESVYNITRVTLINTKGVTLESHQLNINDKTCSMELGRYPIGIYFIQIYHRETNQTVTKKVIRN